MIKLITKLVVLLFVLILTVSCSSESSLQEYYVDSESKNDILMIDIPTNIFTFKEELTADEKQALESVDKLNLLAFKLTDKNVENFITEKTKVKAILKNKKYIELMRLNDNGRKIAVKYLGNDNSMNEVIVYVADNSKGFALARLLGDNMRPENMIKLLESVKNLDKDSPIFKQLEGYFN